METEEPPHPPVFLNPEIVGKFACLRKRKIVAALGAPSSCPQARPGAAVAYLLLAGDEAPVRALCRDTFFAAAAAVGALVAALAPEPFAAGPPPSSAASAAAAAAGDPGALSGLLSDVLDRFTDLDDVVGSLEGHEASAAAAAAAAAEEGEEEEEEEEEEGGLQRGAPEGLERGLTPGLAADARFLGACRG